MALDNEEFTLDPQIKKIISEVLKIEKEYQYVKNLKSAGKQNEVLGKVIRVIEQEIKK